MTLPPAKSKIELRKKAHTLLSLSLEARVGLSRKIVSFISQDITFKRARQVALFYPRDQEPDLLGLWEQRKTECFFPKCTSELLLFFSVKHLEDLQAGYASILEPPANSEHAAKTWAASDLILVPGLLFDEWGARIGSGKGFYDRFLASNPARKWGIGFQVQVDSARLEQESTDIRMDAVVTEAGIRLRKQ